MKHWAEYGFLMALVTGVALSAGCGSDPPTVHHTGPATVEVRNGTWMFTETITYTGDDSCVARAAEVTDTTDVICAVGFGEGAGPFPVDCELDMNGTDVSFDCVVTADLGYCRQFIDLVGSGTVTDTTFDLQTSLFSRIVAKDPKDQGQCDLNFRGTIDPCTTLVSFVGQWISSDGDTLCPADPDSLTPLSLRDLVSEMGSVALR